MSSCEFLFISIPSWFLLATQDKQQNQGKIYRILKITDLLQRNKQHNQQTITNNKQQSLTKNLPYAYLSRLGDIVLVASSVKNAAVKPEICECPRNTAGSSCEVHLNVLNLLYYASK